ncbi:MAG: gliding motility-associated C-terminal domain-containing protein [Bacteroidales bacterium]|nr:gliding motility-associated C-terminal domain-containing protein [Bacteroidales bacterium]
MQIIVLILTLLIKAAFAGNKDLKTPENLLYFIPNKGQIQGIKNTKVLYYATFEKANVYILKDGISFILYQPIEFDTVDNKPIKFKWHRVDYKLVGIETSEPIISTFDSSNFYYNFYLNGNITGIKGIKGYKKIIFKNIYKNIDWCINIKGNAIKYDFIIKPGGNPNDIKITYKHYESLIINETGQLIVNASIGNIIEDKPIGFQKCKNININWVLSEDSIITFKVDNYDLNDTLIIDPFIIWCTYFGGSSFDAAYSAFSTNDFLFLSGTTLSANFPVYYTGGSEFFQGTNNGDYDVFIAKFTSNGVPVWITYYGGSRYDDKGRIWANDNFIYVGGQTRSLNLPLLNPGGISYFDNTSGDVDTNVYVSNKGFIAKFSADGTLMWATFLKGDTGETEILAITANTNYVYTLALTTSKYYPIVGSGSEYVQNSPNNNYVKYAISKFNLETNALVWSTYFCGTNGSDESWHNIQCTDSLLFLVGATTSTNFPVFNSGGGAYFQPTNKGGKDVIIAKFSFNNELLWSTYFGGTGNDVSRGICVVNNKLFIGGETTSNYGFYTYTSFSDAYFQPNFAGFSDAFIAYFDENNQCIYSSYIGGSGADRITALAADTLGLWFAGSSGSNNFPLVNPLTPTYFSNSGSTFVGKLKLNNLYVQWLTKVAPTEVRKITVNNYYLYLIGNTYGTLNNILTNPGNGAYFQNTFQGGMYDSYIIQFDKCVIPQVDVTSVKTQICKYDSTLISATGGISYVWNTGQQNDTIIVSPNSTFTFYVTITDDMYCTNTDSIQITVFQLPNVNIIGAHPICIYDSITIHGTGANTYIWLNSGDTAQFITVYPISDSTFVLLGIDTNLCKNYDTVKIIVYPLPNIYITGAHPICFGDSLTLFGNGGQFYTWAPGNINSDSIIVSPQITTTYYVLGVDSNNCKNIDSTTIVVYSLPNVTITGAHPICYGDSVTLYANGASSYLWLPLNETTTSITVYPSSTTYYYLIGTDTNNCKNYDTTLIVVFPLPDVEITGVHAICYGDSITLMATGALSYLWLPDSIYGNQNTFYLTDTTQYIVIGTDIHGCKNYDTATVIVNPLPDVQILGAHPVCYGDSITLTAINAISYSWNTGENTQYINVIPQYNTYYYVTGTDYNGCKNVDSVYIVVYPLPTVEIRGVHNICLYDSITLTGLGANYYVWLPWNYNTDSITVSPQNNLMVILIGTDNNNCVNSDTAFIEVYPLPTLQINGIQDICRGDSTIITVSGAQLYSWLPENLSGPVNVLSPINTTEYTVIGTDVNGCKDTITFIINVFDIPLASITGNNEICYGDNITLLASGGDEYLWSTGDTTNQITVSPAVTTNYSLIVRKDICYDTTTFTVIVKPKPTLTITTDTTIIIGMSLYLNASGASSYFWNPPTYLSCVTCANPLTTPSDSITYCVIGKNIYDCLDTACVTILVDKECGEIFVPSAFSPNNDGNNDLLYVRGKCIKNMQFEIYDRWGNKVFTSNNPEIPWDGTYNGKEAISGVYVYYLKAEYYNGTKFTTKGNITLIR